MHIDFHHTATYVVARMAGFDHPDASVVAYAAQYVDDATNSGVIQFDNGLLYRRIATAHRTIERINWHNGDNLLCWIPFHFIPGNSGQRAGAPAAGPGRERLICRRDSYLAREMTDACVGDAEAGKPYALHRLGISAHVYADSWAHDGFVGLVDPLNAASDFSDQDEAPLLGLGMRTMGWVTRFLHKKQNFPGHGMALTLPDMPFLSWSYRDCKEAVVRRAHPALFLDAAEGLFRLFCRFLTARRATASGVMAPGHREALLHQFETNRSENPDERHATWLRAVAEGTFGFRETLEYKAKGAGSWKHLALGTVAERDRGDEVFPYNLGFLKSNWFFFHEAAKLHRTYVLESLLPRYGLAVP